MARPAAATRRAPAPTPAARVRRRRTRRATCVPNAVPRIERWRDRLACRSRPRFDRLTTSGGHRCRRRTSRAAAERIRLVGLHDLLHQLMADDVAVVELHELDAVDAAAHFHRL